MELNIFKSAKQIEQLTKDNESLVARLTESERLVNSYKNDNQSLVTMQAEFDAKSAELIKAHEATISKLTEEFTAKQKAHDIAVEEIRKEYHAKLDANEVKLVETKQSANTVAAQVLSNLGVPAEEVPTVPMNTKGSVLEQFNKLQGQEKSAFYQANKDEICKALGLIK